MPTSAEIAAHVEAFKDNPQEILRAANANGVTLTDIQNAIGATERDVAIWLGNNGLTASLFTAGVSGPPAPPPPPPPAPAPAPVGAPVAAPSPTPAPPAPAPAPGTGGVTTATTTGTLATLWANHRSLLIGAAALVALLLFGSAKKGR